MGLRRYLSVRAIHGVITLFFVALLNFVLFRLIPGDPVTAFIGEPQPGTDAAQLAIELRARWGLDKPMWHQLLIYLGRMFSGDLGISYRGYFRGETVWDVIGIRIGWTLLLMGSALIFSIVLGIPTGVFAANRKNTLTDDSLVTGSVIGWSLPTFWFGMIMIIFFALKSGIFPTGGMYTTTPRARYPGAEFFYNHYGGQLSAANRAEHYFDPVFWCDMLYHLILPMMTLVVISTATFALLVRSSMLETLRQDYVRVAYAKGVKESQVINRHALRNALLPTVTVIGLQVGFLLSGAIITESIFNWDGLGSATIIALQSSDLPVLEGIFFIIAITVILSSLFTDIIYSLLDPRIRY